MVELWIEHRFFPAVPSESDWPRLEEGVGKSVASGERYYIRETNVSRDRSESGVGHVGQVSTAQ